MEDAILQKCANHHSLYQMLQIPLTPYQMWHTPLNVLNTAQHKPLALYQIWYTSLTQYQISHIPNSLLNMAHTTHHKLDIKHTIIYQIWHTTYFLLYMAHTTPSTKCSKHNCNKCGTHLSLCTRYDRPHFLLDVAHTIIAVLDVAHTTQSVLDKAHTTLST